ncbi:MAG: NACHT domain-containing protein [Nostocaceae cyanobacterium]|nr:NACHT domain-containing protein [Nostocaceae cyanobacterium]
MLNHPLLVVLLTGLLSSAAGYLINQLPSIKEFPGRNALVVKLTAEIVVLSGIFAWWSATPEKDKTETLKVLLGTCGGVVLVLLLWHILRLGWMLWQTRGHHSTTGHHTTILKTADDWRRELLKAMKIYVETRLNDSLHNQEMIRVRSSNQQEKVGRNPSQTINNYPSPWEWLQPQRLLKVFGGLDMELEEGKPIIEAFDKEDISGRLLILGNPGAGKTTLLLELARDLIERAQHNPDYPIPVLFELSNWRDDQQAIGEWLMADLKFRYNVSEKISRQWLDTDKLLPLLDGLDELGLTRQKKCIDKINQFLQNSSSLLPLVVCCRQEEYIKGEAILENLRGAVCLHSLTEQQIKNYLRRLNSHHLWKTIKNDPEGLGELAKTPLFLNLIPVAYPEGLVKEGRILNSEDERREYQQRCRQELFDAYINRRLGEHHDSKGYKVEDTKRWLQWLAKRMKERNLKEFYIEKIQPDWLVNQSQQTNYGLIILLIFGLFFGLIGFIGFNYGMLYGLLFLLFAVLFGMGFAIIFELQQLWDIKLHEKFILFKINKIKIFNSLIYGLKFGMGGLIRLIISVEPDLNIETKKTPNQGIWKFAINGLIIGLIIALIFGLYVGLIGLFFGGGFTCIKHFFLRLILYHNGYIPWNYARFLTYADERKLIQQVGGRFTFIHDKLQEHFAEMKS